MDESLPEALVIQTIREMRRRAEMLHHTIEDVFLSDKETEIETGETQIEMTTAIGGITTEVMGATDDRTVMEAEAFHLEDPTTQGEMEISMDSTPGGDPQIHRAEADAPDAESNRAAVLTVWSNIELRQSNGRKEKLGKIVSDSRI